MANVGNRKATALASLYLRGWPRFMSRPRLVVAAWCRKCRTAHVLAWSAKWPANRVVGPARGCPGFFARLDDEARKELPELVRRFENCQAGYKAWLKTARRPEPDAGRRMMRRPLTAKGDFVDDS
jgi:hypothetical protein